MKEICTLILLDKRHKILQSDALSLMEKAFGLLHSDLEGQLSMLFDFMVAILDKIVKMEIGMA